MSPHRLPRVITADSGRRTPPNPPDRSSPPRPEPGRALAMASMLKELARLGLQPVARQ